MIKVSWNPAIAKCSFKKHRVSFEEAQTVFFDEFALQFYDDESLEQDRFILLGLSNQSRSLVVVHCERGADKEELRIISARKATKPEQQHYQGDLP